MAQYCFGMMVKEYRKRLGVTQEELCDGICDVSTLSKIESGRRDPYRSLAIALMNKLGIPITLFNLPVTDEELRRAELEFTITSLCGQKNYDFGDLLEEYVNCGKEMDPFEEQFYLYHKVQVKDCGFSLQEKYDILIKAIHITYPSFDFDGNIEKHLFTIYEINILISLCKVLSGLKKRQRAIDLLKKTEISLSNSRNTTKEIIEIYIFILYNLTILYGMEEDFSSSMVYCIKGLEYSYKFNNYRMIPYLLYSKGFLLLKNGQIDEGIEVVKNSQIIFKEFNLSKICELHENDVRRNFGNEVWEKIKNKF